MRLLALAATAALIVPATALGWAWPVPGPVLTAFSFDPAHPYAAGQHRGIDIGADSGSAEPPEHDGGEVVGPPPPPPASAPPAVERAAAPMAAGLPARARSAPVKA